MNKQEIEKAMETIQHNISQFKRLLIEQPNSPVRERIKSEISAYETAISALQQQLTNGWIPVESRLPEESGTYLTSIIFYGYGKIAKEISDGVPQIRLHEFNGEMKSFKHSPFGEYEIIAWQPLPEPYKEVSDAERN